MSKTKKNDNSSRLNELVTLITQISNDRGGNECLDIIYSVATLITHAQNRVLSGAKFNQELSFDETLKIQVFFGGKNK